jgi:hypothetical protein
MQFQSVADCSPPLLILVLTALHVARAAVDSKQVMARTTDPCQTSNLMLPTLLV